MIDCINNADKQLSNINEQIAAYQTSIREAQDKIAELNELRTQELTDKLPDESNESYRSMLLAGIGYDEFIPAGNEPSAVLARAFGECREGQIPRSSAAHQA